MHLDNVIIFGPEVQIFSDESAVYLVEMAFPDGVTMDPEKLVTPCEKVQQRNKSVGN